MIDQLVEAYGARIFLTGALGDEAVAAGIVRRLRHPDSVTSMIGTSPLAELPAMMAGASLFLGNDSGVKHIAAGLGIPTVGVHGGTLDPREWGPVGPNAVAIARDMVCSPCYLSQVEDCHRGLACLQLLEPGRVYDACKRLLLLAAPAQPALRPARSKPHRPARAGTRPFGAPQDDVFLKFDHRFTVILRRREAPSRRAHQPCGFSASARRAVALPRGSGCGWLGCGAQPHRKRISKLAGIRPALSPKRSP